MENKKLGVAGIVSIVFAVSNAVGVLMSVGYSLHVRSKFLKIFEDLGTELPGVTQMILNPHWSIWILVSLVLLVLLAVKELISKKWIPLLINGLYVLLGIVYWAVFSTALMLPLIRLVQSIENGQ